MFVKRRRLPIWKYRHSDNTNQSNVCIGGCEQCRPTRISPDSEPTSRGFFRHVDVAVETEMQSVIEIATDDNAGDLDLKPDTVFSNILCVQCDQLNIMSIQIDEAIKEASEAHNGQQVYTWWLQMEVRHIFRKRGQNCRQYTTDARACQRQCTHRTGILIIG
eukprot:GHVQ01026929.1.p1 GENE.GHVQ01026929.1~~GHVQ01026929.1.p1  ORF type:complete len:162 (+),score=4.72 GHVQ01026929.1:400-885(+)